MLGLALAYFWLSLACTWMVAPAMRYLGIVSFAASEDLT